MYDYLITRGFNLPPNVLQPPDTRELSFVRVSPSVMAQRLSEYPTVITPKDPLHQTRVLVHSQRAFSMELQSSTLAVTKAG